MNFSRKITPGPVYFSIGKILSWKFNSDIFTNQIVLGYQVDFNIECAMLSFKGAFQGYEAVSFHCAETLNGASRVWPLERLFLGFSSIVVYFKEK